ncbi:MAG: FKBP-type peptidyl-prolyl cis-trans isomerase [Gemmatimonadetes bacterium]|jgi:FKBP-type peptidyl-prolyl cis-trans isomerase FkpA|nr:FKBP-type peptidyl-prolyl cis-trans isomerase [Gemmatimonadota bacterium]
MTYLALSRFRTSGPFLAVLLLTACGDSFEVIEETNFAEVLNIDLTTMTRTSSGLYIEQLAEGTGPAAVAGQRVTVSYTGWLSNGSSFDDGQFTFTLGVGEVVAGFDEGVLGMRVDGARRIIIPPELGYGAAGQGPIPGGSVLIFRIQVVGIT